MLVQPSGDITPDTAYAVDTSFAVQRWQLLHQRGCDILITLRNRAENEAAFKWWLVWLLRTSGIHDVQPRIPHVLQELLGVAERGVVG